MLQFCANLGFLWPNLALLDRIAAAGAAGFKTVEFHWPYGVPATQLRHACEQAGVRAIGLNTSAGDTHAGEFGLGALPGREVDFSADIDRAISYARRIGAGSIHVMAGIVPQADKRRAEEQLATNLSLAAERAPDLTLLLEPINRRDRPGYLYSTVEKAAAMIERVGAPNLGILFDVYHVGVAQGDVLRRLEQHLPLIGHVQIAAVPSRAEPDEGEIAYGAVFAALERLGYRGYIGCEYRPRSDTNAGLRWLKTLGVSL
ncbi:MAG: TIM barrel protein [Gammaproteobacteria bacterium]